MAPVYGLTVRIMLQFSLTSNTIRFSGNQRGRGEIKFV